MWPAMRRCCWRWQSTPASSRKTSNAPRRRSAGSAGSGRFPDPGSRFCGPAQPVMMRIHAGRPSMPGFCRDCSADVSEAAPRCAACGSPRLVRHALIHELAIAHVDCDAFYAAVEKRDDPSLADKPLIIGGGKRGVVSTACYVARTYGIHSAMPMFKARKLCPHATVLPPDMRKYVKVGRQVRGLMLELTPQV